MPVDISMMIENLDCQWVLAGDDQVEYLPRAGVALGDILLLQVSIGFCSFLLPS
jgi:hypothetical protein